MTRQAQPHARGRTSNVSDDDRAHTHRRRRRRVGPARRRERAGRALRDRSPQRREASVFVVAIALMVYFGINRLDFLSQSNLLNIAQATAPIAIVAIGDRAAADQRRDRPVGRHVVRARAVPHALLRSTSTACLSIPAILMALLVGGWYRLGQRVRHRRLAGAVVRRHAGHRAMRPAGHRADHLARLPGGDPAGARRARSGHWIGPPSGWAELIWAVVIVLVFHVVLTRTRWGLHTISVGGNQHWRDRRPASRSRRIKIGNFMIASVLGAFAGIAEAFRIPTPSTRTSAADAPIVPTR